MRTAGLSSVDVEVVDVAAGLSAGAGAGADMAWCCAIALSAMTFRVVKEAYGGICRALQGDFN